MLSTGAPCVETEAWACTTGAEPPVVVLVFAVTLLDEPPTEVEARAVVPELLADTPVEVETDGAATGLCTDADACAVTGAVEVDAVALLVAGTLTDAEADTPGAAAETRPLVAGDVTAPAVFCVADVTGDVVLEVVETAEPSGPLAAHAWPRWMAQPPTTPRNRANTRVRIATMIPPRYTGTA